MEGHGFVHTRSNSKNTLEPNTASAVKPSRIFGYGEMADLTRAFDWSKTSLGSIERWPDVLLITLNTLLASPHPMFLWWGSELIQFYNDAYKKSLSEEKHPEALGQRGHLCWSEIWPLIGPQIGPVMANGDAIWREDQVIPRKRGGRIEPSYWTYAYGPVRDLDGEIVGTLATCIETTHKQVALQILHQELSGLNDVFDQAPAFFTILRGPNHIFERVNPLYQKLLGPRTLIGKPVREAVPEVEAQGFIEVLDMVYQTGEPFVGHNMSLQLADEESSELQEHFVDFVYHPMRSVDGSVCGIMVVGLDVTDAVLSKKELENGNRAFLGGLASSIAHEIMDALDPVMTFIRLARSNIASADATRYLETAEQRTNQVAAIVTRTLRFGRQLADPQLVSSRELIDNALMTFEERLAHQQIIVARRDQHVRLLLCHVDEVHALLRSLIKHAIDAMKDKGGRLLVRTREGIERTTQESGLFFTVADSGLGMTREEMSKLFELRVSPRGVDAQGLNFWSCLDITDRHKGRLWVKSSQRNTCRGTVLRLFLPLSPRI
jgi:signal transduction histidine kinase